MPIFFIFYFFLPGRSEFTPLNGVKKTSDRAYLFFGGGYIESENCFETLKGSTIECKRKMLELFGISGILLDFFKIFF